MRCKYLVALFAASVLLMCGCSAHRFVKPELFGQKLVKPASERTATDIEQTPRAQPAVIKAANDEKKLRRFIDDPISCTKGRIASMPRIIPFGADGILMIKSGRDGEEGLAIGVRVGNFIVAFPVFDPCAGFAPPASPVIIYGGISDGPAFLPGEAAPAVEENLAWQSSK